MLQLCEERGRRVFPISLLALDVVRGPARSLSSARSRGGALLQWCESRPWRCAMGRFATGGGAFVEG